MKLVECGHCGGKKLVPEHGLLVCAYCRARFVPQAEDSPPKETVIGIASDIQTLLQRCKDEPHNSQRYASLILDLDPTNQEAQLYF